MADYYKIKVADMYSKKRPAALPGHARFAMYLAKELTQKSLPESASCLAGDPPRCCMPCARFQANASS